MESYIKTHLFYILLIVAGIFGARYWLHEHDARVQAEAEVKQEQLQVKDLQQQILAVNLAAQKQVQVIVKTVQAAKTPEQVVAAIPQLTDIPLNARVVPNNQVDVTVDSQGLVKELGQCKMDRTNLDACQENTIALNKIVAAKDLQLAALQKKPTFFHRLWAYTKVGLAFAGIGFTLGKGL